MKILCDYGCGKDAKHKFKNGKMCCENNQSKCPSIRNKRSNSMKGNIPWNKGVTKETSDSMRKNSESNKKNWDLDNRRKELSNKNRIKWKDPNSKFNSKEYRKKLSKPKITIEKLKMEHSLFYKIEDMNYDPENPNEIQVRCKNQRCSNSKEKNGWFTPTRIQLQERIRQLENINGNGGSYFYCSKYCKDTCRLFKKRVSQLIKEDEIKAGIIEDNTPESGEYEIFRQEVIKRVELEYGKLQCEICGNINIDELSVHHEKPMKTNPEMSLDPDNGWVLCSFGKGNNCHLKVGHSIKECKTGNLANKICMKKTR